MSKYRLYALDVRGVVHQDEFEECDNSQPYYDDYYEFSLPDLGVFDTDVLAVLKLDCSNEQKVEIIEYLSEVYFS